MESQRTIYRGTYKGIVYRAISELHSGESEWWWGEILLTNLQFRNTDDLKILFPRAKTTYDELGRPRITCDVPRFSSSPITLDSIWVRHSLGDKREPVTSYLGWDYQHIWHDDLRVNLGVVRNDCIKYIDWLKRTFKIMEACTYCGCFGDPEEEQWIIPEKYPLWHPIHPICAEKANQWHDEEEVKAAKRALQDIYSEED